MEDRKCVGYYCFCNGLTTLPRSEPSVLISRFFCLSFFFITRARYRLYSISSARAGFTGTNRSRRIDPLSLLTYKTYRPRIKCAFTETSRVLEGSPLACSYDHGTTTMRTIRQEKKKKENEKKTANNRAPSILAVRAHSSRAFFLHTLFIIHSLIDCRMCLWNIIRKTEGTYRVFD